MEPYSKTNLVNISDIKKVLKMDNWFGTLVAKCLMGVMGINRMNRHYYDCNTKYGRDFTQALFKSYNIKYEIPAEQLDKLPKEGPFIIVSNHPFGGWDGVVLFDAISSVRPDFRIITNFLLSYIPNLKEYFLSVNPFSDNKSLRSSVAGIKNAKAVLENGGVLGIFPAGEVATYYGKKYPHDKTWEQAIMKLVLGSNVPVVPVYFDGTNSKWFHFVGKIHPMLRTVNLIKEFNKRENSTITLKIGKPIGISELSKFKDIKSLSSYLRSRTYALEANVQRNIEQKILIKNEKPLPAEPDYTLLANEIEEVRKRGGFLFKVSKYECFITETEVIPNIMHEIGRKREESFREVGEGTGNAIDTDKYDEYYKHLILWDQEAQRVVGAYRLGIGEDIYKKYGVKGFYTSTLFNFSDEFIKKLPDCIELGRSYLAVEYKKEALPLMLLIKGLLYTVTNYPRTKYLFGPASISSWIPPFYRSVIVKGLSGCVSKENEKLVSPKTPFKEHNLRCDLDWLLKDKTDNIDFLDKYIQRLSDNCFRVPTLIKKYIKLNAEILAFNVDKEFNYCVDGMIFLDLDNVPVEEITSLTKGSDDPERLLKRFS